MFVYFEGFTLSSNYIEDQTHLWIVYFYIIPSFQMSDIFDIKMFIKY